MITNFYFKILPVAQIVTESLANIVNVPIASVSRRMMKMTWTVLNPAFPLICSVWKKPDRHCNVWAAIWAWNGAHPGAEVRGVHRRTRADRGGHFPSPRPGQRCQTVQRSLWRRRKTLLPQVVQPGADWRRFTFAFLIIILWPGHDWIVF